MRFAFIDAEKARWPVEVQCDVLGVSRSGYYAWKGRPEAPRVAEDAEIVAEIKAAHEAGRGNYGGPRVHRELRAAWPASRPNSTRARGETSRGKSSGMVS